MSAKGQIDKNHWVNKLPLDSNLLFSCQTDYIEDVLYAYKKGLAYVHILTRMFTFAYSPHGEKYWFEIVHGRQTLSDDDEVFLRYLLAKKRSQNKKSKFFKDLQKTMNILRIED